MRPRIRMLVSGWPRVGQTDDPFPTENRPANYAFPTGGFFSIFRLHRNKHHEIASLTWRHPVHYPPPTTFAGALSSIELSHSITVCAAAVEHRLARGLEVAGVLLLVLLNAQLVLWQQGAVHLAVHKVAQGEAAPLALLGLWREERGAA